jgi:uncharacterized protein YkwD
LEFQPVPEPRRGRRWGLLLVAVIVAAILAIVTAIYVLPGLDSVTGFLSGNASYTSKAAISPANIGSNDTFDSSAGWEISYPSNYEEFANYSVSAINQDRENAGLSPVVLSQIPSAQQHADSMLQNHYFSHWDTQGYKPYMRYSILNGTGFVEENVAYEATTIPSFISTSSVEAAISGLEYQMMNNDSICCQNGHRDNILTRFHNQVSIGIAYDSTNVYFVEDFETFLVNLATPIIQGDTITLTGSTVSPVDPNSVLIFYDSPPQQLTAAQLNTQYYGSYDQGTFLGGIVPPCNAILGRCLQFAEGVTDQAQTWQVSSNSIDIQFSLSDFANKSGNGVYTVYLVEGSQANPEYLTSISIFVTT